MHQLPLTHPFLCGFVQVMENIALGDVVRQFAAELEAAVRKNVLDTLLASFGASAPAALKAAPAAKKAAVVAATPKRRPGRPKKVVAKAAPAPAAPAARAKKAAAPAPKAKAAKKSAAGGGGRVRRTPAEIEQTAHKILEFVRKNPNAKAEKIKAALGLDKAQWLAPIARLIESKQLRMTGMKRAATYSVL